MTNNQIQAAADVLKKYLLPDCLKPEYDGMSLYEITKLALAAGESEPSCFHQCTSNCRREGCNCECGEWHEKLPANEN